MSNIDELITQLQDPNPDIRSSAVEALAKTSDSGTIAPLITALQNEFEWVRGRALQGLKDIGSPAVPLLIIALENPNPQVCRKASCVLDNIGYELKDIGDFRAVAPLIDALKDKHARVRSRAAYALSRIGNPSAIKPLIATIRDGAPNVRINALHALSKFGESTAAALTSALADPTTSVRRHTITVLEKTGNKGAIPQLQKMARDELDASVQWAAKRALRKLRG